MRFIEIVLETYTYGVKGGSLRPPPSYFFLVWKRIKSKCRLAGSEHYVRMHITEPPCLVWPSKMLEEGCPTNLCYNVENFGSYMEWL